MTRVHRTLSVAVLTAALSFPLRAQDGELSDSGSPTRYRNKLTVTPFLAYSPQTKLVLGAGGGWQFKTGAGAYDSATRSSVLAGFGSFTTAGQWSIGGSLSRYTRGNRWWIDLGAQGAFFPLTYYGIGPFTEEADTNEMRNHLFEVDARVARQVARHLYTGLYYRLRAYWNIDWEFPARIPDTLPGADGARSSGLGITLLYDSRNSTFTPTRGWFLLVEALANHEVIGSDRNYGTVVADARHYVRVTRRDIVAFNLVGQFNGSAVPIQSMSMLSGQTSSLLMRGVYLGRFRDRHQLVGQADYRGSLGGRWGYVVFGAAGNIFGSGTSVWDEMKFTGGLGIRFDVNPRDRLNLRADYTFTSFGERGFSFGAAEAF